MRSKQIQIKLTEEEKARLVKAAHRLGQGHTTFTRAAGLEKANKILSDEKNES